MIFKNKLQIRYALAMGYMISNIHNHIVYVDEKGNQIRSNKRRKRKYNFSHPNYWRIIESRLTLADKIVLKVLSYIGR